MENVSGFGLLIDAALKGTILLLAATALVVLLRRHSAASRHLVWQFAVVAILMLPLVKVVSPLRLPVLPQLRSPIEKPEVAAPVTSVTTSRAASASPSTAHTTAPEQVSERADLNITTSTNRETATTAASTPWPVRIISWLAIAWIAVAGLLVLRLALGFALVRWFALRAYPLYEDGWAELNQELSGLVGVRRPIHLFASPHTATPMTWGILHPVVMLPSAAEDWSLERKRIVLLHEFAHIRRRDSLTHMFAQLACAVYWFHPLVWQAAARMRAEAERACDDLVLQAGTKASVYADHLLELIRTVGGMRTPALALPMAQRSTFEGRLLAILEPQLDRTTPRRVAVAGMIVVVALLIFPLAGLTTVTGSSAEPTPILSATADPDAPGRTDGEGDGAGEGTSQPNHDVAASVNIEPPKSSVLDNFVDDIASLAARAGKTVLEDVLKSSDGQARASVVVIGPLVQALKDVNVDVRLAAAQSLGGFEDSLAVAALSNALRSDADARVRKMAAWALGNIESEDGLPALMHALRSDRDIDVRRTSVWALGQIEESAAVPALNDAIRDADAQVRSLAVWALGQIEDRAAVPALVEVLKSGDVEMRRQAAWALGQIEDASAVSGLAAALRDSDEKVREQAVWALGQIESGQAVAPLSALVNDPNAATRKQVAWALGQIEDASAVPALSTLLREDKVADVRQTAAWALGQIESPNAVPALNAALKDASAGVRRQAAWALGQIEARPAPAALLDALKDADKGVRSMAAWALSQIEDPAAGAALRASLNDSDPAVRQAVLHALVSLGDQLGYEALAEMLKDADPLVRRAAAAAMGGRRGSWPNPQPMPMPQPRPRPMPQPDR